MVSPQVTVDSPSSQSGCSHDTSGSKISMAFVLASWALSALFASAASALFASAASALFASAACAFALSWASAFIFSSALCLGAFSCLGLHAAKAKIADRQRRDRGLCDISRGKFLKIMRILRKNVCVCLFENALEARLITLALVEIWTAEIVA